ncbi:MAG TPA: porphobilinogen synthase [Nitrospiria bacterium]|nr:porphobilinogen synthase [Nitrospiria bacterium]
MYFPVFRPRRLRTTEQHRRMVRETHLLVDDLIYPLFVLHGKAIRNEIVSMPGVAQLSVDLLVKEAQEVYNLGIPAVILFGIPRRKDSRGSEAYAKDGIIQQAVRAVKDKVPDLLVITDVCLCEYTDHGHCGVVKGNKVLNDPSLELLTKAAISHAQAGADIVAPSDMMDGRVRAIRKALDETGFDQIPILSYAAKFASAFYSPFREAAGSAPRFGDRKSYQMDPPNVREALREIEMDIQEGADIVMIKPALAYLDIIHQARNRFNRPIAAYNVSGEYAMVKAAAQMHWIDEGQVVQEILTCIKRAGADLILTYFAKDVARRLTSPTR